MATVKMVDDRFSVERRLIVFDSRSGEWREIEPACVEPTLFPFSLGAPINAPAKGDIIALGTFQGLTAEVERYNHLLGPHGLTGELDKGGMGTGLIVIPC